MRSEEEYYRAGQEQEGSTRDFSFEATAQSLGVPRENWGNPTVREFVGSFNSIQQLQADLSEASSRSLRQGTVGGLFGTPAETLQRTAREVGGMNPSLARRYSRAELLMRATME